MKVLHVIPSLSAVHGGPTRALETIERALAARGIEVETATTDDDGPGRRSGKRCGVALAENGVVRRYFAKRTEFYKSSPQFARWMARNARAYDLVHIHALFSFTTPAAAWAARAGRVPYVVRPLGTLDRYGLEHRRPWAKRLSLGVIEGPVLRHAAAVHFTSEAEAQAAAALGIAWKPAVIPLAVETPATISPSPAREASPGVQLLYLSRLDPKKNVEGLLEALARLAAQGQRPALTVAGGGSAQYADSLRQRAADLGVADQVTWAGPVEGETKWRLLSAAQVFVLPSFSENFGIAAAEALACGVPCVLGTGVAIAAEAARAGAALSIGTDAASIAHAIAQLLSDASMRERMSQQAAQFAHAHYSVDAMGRALQQLYEEIVAR